MQTDFQNILIIYESVKKNWIFIELELGQTFARNIQALQTNINLYHVILLWKLNHIL